MNSGRTSSVGFSTTRPRGRCRLHRDDIRRDPVLLLPEPLQKVTKETKGAKRTPQRGVPTKISFSPVRRTLEAFTRDVDLLGMTLNAYAKKLMHNVVALGRAGTPVDWSTGLLATSGEAARAYISMYAAESLNTRLADNSVEARVLAVASSSGCARLRCQTWRIVRGRFSKLWTGSCAGAATRKMR
jgi:hypothetical protein